MKFKSLIRLAVLVVMCLRITGVSAHPYAIVDTIGQRYNRFSLYRSPEKLFLHIDRTYYAIDETIYFMGYLENADRLSVLPPGNFIYVELLDKDGKSVVRQKVKRGTSGFQGQLYLPEDLLSGDYVLRAYTLWQVNGNPEYMFHENIRILGVGPAPSSARDSTDDDIDISFYPEGGRYYAGHLSRIAFKAMIPNGKSVDFSGSLVNSAGTEIMNVASSHEGMGYFVFIPQEDENYAFKVNGKLYPLPDSDTDGVTMNVGRTSKYLYVGVYGPLHGTFCLLSRDATGVNYLGRVVLSDSDRHLRVGMKDFKPGINHLILTDVEGHILSERLFYVQEDPSETPLCTFRTNAERYEARELVKTMTTLTERDGVTPVEGTFSISVVRGGFGNYSQKDDIVSYMKLSSELKGRISNPGYYFDRNIPENVRDYNMDLLMMVQGWRYYDIEKIFADASYSGPSAGGKEYVQRITGTITNPYSEKTPHKFSFTVFAPKLHAIVAEGVQESRSFELDSLDFEDGTGFFIKIGRDHGVNNYQPKWDGEKFAPKFVYKDNPGHYYPLLSGAETPAPIVMDKNMMTDTIAAAVVSVAAEYDPYTDNNRGWEKNESDLKLYSEQTLLEYLQYKQPAFSYDDSEGNMINKYAESSTLSSSSKGLGKVKLIVDDTEEEWWMFDDLKLEDIEKMSISSHPNTYYNSPGGLVSIKLISGKTLARMSKKDPTLTYFVPLGYQQPAKFYAPRYDKGDKFEGFDHRNTILWRPAVSTSGGKAGVFFSNTDQMDYPYIVHIEGRAKDGRWFSWHGKIINK